MSNLLNYYIKILYNIFYITQVVYYCCTWPLGTTNKSTVRFLKLSKNMLRERRELTENFRRHRDSDDVSYGPVGPMEA